MFCTSLEYYLLVAFPLFALSLYFPWLIPLAIASLTASAAVCMLGAAQAELPTNKTRFWSRPLVAALFFLQPLARGWARYRTRLHLRAAPPPAAAAQEVRKSLQSEPARQLCFWSKNGTDRFSFLQAILAGLNRRRIATSLDSGWENYDVQILQSPWAKSTLITASEYLAQGKIFLRCRLVSRWSALGVTAFLLLALLASLLIEQFAKELPWVWMILAALPLLGWYLEDHCKYQKSLMETAVRGAAGDLGLEPFVGSSS